MRDRRTVGLSSLGSRYNDQENAFAFIFCISIFGTRHNIGRKKNLLDLKILLVKNIIKFSVLREYYDKETSFISVFFFFNNRCRLRLDNER